MAREAGCDEIYVSNVLMGIHFKPKSLERFFHMAQAAERESMIKQGWRQCAKGQRTTQFCGMVEKAVQEEREACIDIVAIHGGSVEIESAIRARGNQ